MNRHKLNIASLNPWPIRLAFLIVIGLPIIMEWPLVRHADVFNDLLNWVLYGCFIWLFISLNLGVDQLLSQLTFAVVIGLNTVILGGGILRLLRFFGLMTISGDHLSYLLTIQLIRIMVIIPYSIFFVNCFSVSNFVLKLSRNGGRLAIFAIHIALALRVLQHVSEIVTALLSVWKEENPLKILPRHRRDWNISLVGKLTFLLWVRQMILTWAFALLLHTLEAIPYLVQDIKRASKYNNRS